MKLIELGRGGPSEYMLKTGVLITRTMKWQVEAISVSEGVS